MNTNFEDRLRTDMERFTRDIQAPAGLPVRAYRHNRQRRRTLRVAVASGAATAVAATGVVIAGVSGAFGPAPAAQTAQTTAYVLRHVENALAPASVGNLIDVSRVVFPPGTPQEPVVGGLNGASTTSGASSPWTVAYMLHWDYQGSQKYSAYSPSGRHVFDMQLSIGNGSATQTTVIYGDRTWWTATVPTGQPGSPGCSPGSSASSGSRRVTTSGSIGLSNGPGNGWPAFIRSQLSCGAYTVAGRQLVNGIDAIKITGQPGRLTLFVNPATYLPIQLDIGPLRMSFQWLPATPANLAQLKVSVPAGYQQVPPPAQN
jgi:hypothetical protein